MNRQAHDREAEYRYRQAINAIGAGDLNGAGEFIWLTVVHAVSAADTDHEHTNPDAFGNPHQAPNSERNYNQAAGRINDPLISPADYQHCLHIAQRELHNNAYHLRHSPVTIIPHIQAGLSYASRLIQTAHRATAPPPPQPLAGASGST